LKATGSPGVESRDRQDKLRVRTIIREAETVFQTQVAEGGKLKYFFSMHSHFVNTTESNAHTQTEY